MKSRTAQPANLESEATSFLKLAGFDEHGRNFDTTATDSLEEDTSRHRDYFEQQKALDEIETETKQRQNALEVAEIKQAARGDEERAKAFSIRGEYERAEEALRHAHELHELAKATARHTLRTHALFSEVFAHAVNAGNWHIAQAHLIDAIKSSDADYALKLASVKALAEIVTFVPGDKGCPFDGPWLAGLAGIPLRTAQDLIASARAIESGVATILTGTEYGSQRAIREFIDMTSVRRREATNAVRQCLTRYLLEHAVKKEAKQRSRNISISELRALALAGFNNEMGWERLISLGIAEGNAWLANELDNALRKRVLSERSEAAAKKTLHSLRTRIRRNEAAVGVN